MAPRRHSGGTQAALYVDKQSAGRLVVVRRPLLVGGEVEGMGRLKGDLDLVGEELLGELREGLG